MADDKEIIEEAEEMAEAVEEAAEEAIEAVEEAVEEAEEAVEAVEETADNVIEIVEEEAEAAEETPSDMILPDEPEEPELITEAYDAIIEEPKKKVPASTIIHWTVHVIMAVIIAIMCFVMFSDTGKLMQTYGFDEANQITTTYKNHDWASVGIDLDSYAYYYDMYNEYFATYETEYKEMGINNMSDLMDAMYDSMVSYYSTDTTTTTN